MRAWSTSPSRGTSSATRRRSFAGYETVETDLQGNENRPTFQERRKQNGPPDKTLQSVGSTPIVAGSHCGKGISMKRYHQELHRMRREHRLHLTRQHGW